MGKDAEEEQQYDDSDASEDVEVTAAKRLVQSKRPLKSPMVPAKRGVSGQEDDAAATKRRKRRPHVEVMQIFSLILPLTKIQEVAFWSRS